MLPRDEKILMLFSGDSAQGLRRLDNRHESADSTAYIMDIPLSFLHAFKMQQSRQQLQKVARQKKVCYFCCTINALVPGEVISTGAVTLPNILSWPDASRGLPYLARSIGVSYDKVGQRPLRWFPSAVVACRNPSGSVRNRHLQKFRKIP
jgi:hypothetical protein